MSKSKTLAKQAKNIMLSGGVMVPTAAADDKEAPRFKISVLTMNKHDRPYAIIMVLKVTGNTTGKEIMDFVIKQLDPPEHSDFLRHGIVHIMSADTLKHKGIVEGDGFIF